MQVGTMQGSSAASAIPRLARFALLRRPKHRQGLEAARAASSDEGEWHRSNRKPSARDLEVWRSAQAVCFDVDCAVPYTRSALNRIFNLTPHYIATAAKCAADIVACNH
jgi:hypothetical protein